MIDRYLLRYFLAVIDHGSFSRAAKQLNVAQPTLSIGIRRLEESLGAAVFTRSSRRIHLTEAGTRLQLHARRIEHEFNLAAAAVQGVAPSGQLRFGLLSTYPMAPIAAMLGCTMLTRGSEKVQMTAGTERELQHRLDRCQLDVALTIIRGDTPALYSELLFTEGYTVAMSATHHLARKRLVTAEELADNTMIVRRHCEALPEISRHFIGRGVRPFLAFRSTNDEQVLLLVQAGVGVTVMPASYSFEGVARPVLSGFTIKRSIGLLYAADKSPSHFPASPLLNAIRTRLSLLR